MNDQNLIPAPQRTESERRAIAQMGGRASGRARRLKSRGRKLIQDLLAIRVKDPRLVDALCEAYGINPSDLSHEVVMTLRQIQKAEAKGDTYAYNSVLKAAGISEDAAVAPAVGLQINVADPAAAEGLRRAIANGAQPAAPENETTQD